MISTWNFATKLEPKIWSFGWIITLALGIRMLWYDCTLIHLSGYDYCHLSDIDYLFCHLKQIYCVCLPWISDSNFNLVDKEEAKIGFERQLFNMGEFTSSIRNCGWKRTRKRKSWCSQEAGTYFRVDLIQSKYTGPFNEWIVVRQQGWWTFAAWQITDSQGTQNKLSTSNLSSSKQYFSTL